jgi:hypothetical protein
MRLKEGPGRHQYRYEQGIVNLRIATLARSVAEAAQAYAIPHPRLLRGRSHMAFVPRRWWAQGMMAKTHAVQANKRP